MSEHSLPIDFGAYDQLATMVALARPDGHCLLANATLENTVGLSRRALQRGSVLDWLADPAQLRDTLVMVAGNQVATSRFDALMKRQGTGGGELPVHVIVCQTDWPDCVLVEMIEIEQQIRLDREERTHGLAQANKELVRNLAHEIKNPLGGIRGAAQLLAMEVARRSSPNTRASSSTRPTACRRWSIACWRRTAGRRWWPMSTSTRSASACVR